MNNRRGHRLKDWTAQVQADSIPALQTFATGLEQDLAAVVVGLSLRFSSGALEGHNNKTKMLKRPDVRLCQLGPPTQTRPARRMRPVVAAAWTVTTSPRTTMVLSTMSSARWNQRSWKRSSSVTRVHDRGFGDPPWPWHGK
ncbi:transposase [Streptomyces roseus]|uniref:transposase n=1 Tax=Streptomyces roseus TaxID=66430 RepID=UPI0037F96947